LSVKATGNNQLATETYQLVVQTIQKFEADIEVHIYGAKIITANKFG
jgi:hypothetical protein